MIKYKYNKLAEDIENKLSYNEKKMIIRFIFKNTNIPITKNNNIVVLEFNSITTSEKDFKNIREKINIFINKCT